jgi:aspartate/methionine/tyrosine aminotransferase
MPVAGPLKAASPDSEGTFGILPREQILALGASRIREIANAAMGRSGVLPFWFGESDVPTAEFIRQAGVESLAAGETFYTHNLGLPELRDAIAAYRSRLHNADLTPDRIAVVSSGMSGLMLTAQMLLSPGDRVVIVTPVWPNVTELPRILGADVIRVPLEVRDDRWSLDLDRLLDALTPGTRAVILNSPNNPTGWTIDAVSQRAVFAHCRRLGIWVVTDDVYERLVFDGSAHAPSLLPLVEPDDRYISVTSFSKAWSMTGWRAGWIEAPAPFIAELGKVIEYNTSCAPKFVQAGAIAALRDNRGEAAVGALRERLMMARKLLFDGLARHAEIEAPMPAGAMYAFIRIAGFDDDMALARALLETAGLGLAPGSAFGPEGKGWLRWCFAAGPDKVADGIGRLDGFLADRRRF